MTVSNASPAAAAETLILNPHDGVPITALRYAANGPVRGHLVVAGATGVPQLFYKAFAEFASAHGYTTLTLDYRGIGLSRPASLKGFRMAYLDWAHQDLAAAVDAMAHESLPLFMVGHSLAVTPSACCPTPSAWPASTPLPPVRAGTVGCRLPSA